MEVFDTLPSMYTQEKWAQLQTKRRCDLNFEHLYWLSRFDPQNQDGYHLQNLIDTKIGTCRDGLKSIIIPVETKVGKLSIRLSELDDSLGRFRNEVANTVKLRESMHDIVEENDKLKSSINQHDNEIKAL